MSRTALGWRSHSGWAVMVVVREPGSSPSVLTRQRIELVGKSLPQQPYHAVVERGLPAREAHALIERVEKMSVAAAVTATRAVVREFAVEAVGVVGRRRGVPDDLERILASHALLHAAEGRLFDVALVEGATQLGLPVAVLEPERIAVSEHLEVVGKRLGPPWQKDHKLAAAAALLALDHAVAMVVRSRRRPHPTRPAAG